MKKLLYLIIPIVLILLGWFIYIYVYWFQSIYTDRDIYTLWDKKSWNWIDGYWSDLVIQWWGGCWGHKTIQIISQESGKKQIRRYPDEEACVDGVFIRRWLGCDVISFRKFPKIVNYKGEFAWDLKIYEDKWIVKSCYDPRTNKEIFKNLQGYDLINVTSGKYKITIWNASKIIEIK